MIHSVLERVRRSDVCHDPYPHVVVRDCLPEYYYRQLSAEYPADKYILDMNSWRNKGDVRQNQRNDICAHQVLASGSLVSEAWREFVRYHTSGHFFRELVGLLGPEINTTYPFLERTIGRPLGDCSTGIRFDPEQDQGEISLDCQIGINTPVTSKSSVRRVHADATEELYAMLLYFRREDDDFTGGDLEIYRWKKSARRRFVGAEVEEHDAELVKTIKYEANTLVLFINSAISLHAVSDRSVTPRSRRLVNIIGEVYRSVPPGLFVKHQKYAKSSLARTTRSVLGSVKRRVSFHQLT
jgi:hypothetical protein